MRVFKKLKINGFILISYYAFLSHEVKPNKGRPHYAQFSNWSKVNMCSDIEIQHWIECIYNPFIMYYGGCQGYKTKQCLISIPSFDRARLALAHLVQQTYDNVQYI